ncbi:MAG: hypothetical protein JRI25_21655 [Deltaproteobacteria bacterium]|nr:hypothetical protein [Deltaproteobacteria bacterium]
MLGFLALVVDIGVLQLSHTELHAGTDAAALAGAGHLDGTTAGIDRAMAEAVHIASQNAMLGEPIRLDPTQVVPGYWDPEAKRFVPSADPERVDTLRVQTDVLEIGTFFAGAVFGRMFTETDAVSVARAVQRTGTGAVDCYLPIAVPDCFLGSEGIEDIDLRMVSANDDNVGWARVNSHPNASYIRQQLRGACDGERATVDDLVGLENGLVESALSEVRRQIEDSDAYWDEERWGSLPPPMGSDDGSSDGESKSTLHDYGRVIEGPIILYETPGGTCGSDTQFNGLHPITGFAWGVIHDVDDHGEGKNIRARLDLSWDYEFGTGGGGADTNVLYREPGELVY